MRRALPPRDHAPFTPACTSLPICARSTDRGAPPTLPHPSIAHARDKVSVRLYQQQERKKNASWSTMETLPPWTPPPRRRRITRASSPSTSHVHCRHARPCCDSARRQTSCCMSAALEPRTSTFTCSDTPPPWQPFWRSASQREPAHRALCSWTTPITSTFMRVRAEGVSLALSRARACGHPSLSLTLLDARRARSPSWHSRVSFARADGAPASTQHERAEIAKRDIKCPHREAEPTPFPLLAHARQQQQRQQQQRRQQQHQ